LLLGFEIRKQCAARIDRMVLIMFARVCV
jgi:hypothetical protein